MAGREVGSRDWTREEIERGLAAWLRLGTSAAAAAETSIPAGTLRSIKHRHPEYCRALQQAHARALSNLREEIATAAAEGVREAVHVARRALRGEAPIDARDAAAILKALGSVDTSIDKIARLDAGSPTEITEDRRSDGDLIREIEAKLNDPAMRAAMEQGFAESEA